MFAGFMVSMIGGTAICAALGGLAGVVWAGVFGVLVGMLTGITRTATS